MMDLLTITRDTPGLDDGHGRVTSTRPSWPRQVREVKDLVLGHTYRMVKYNYSYLCVYRGLEDEANALFEEENRCDPEKRPTIVMPRNLMDCGLLPYRGEQGEVWNSTNRIEEVD